MKKIQWKKGKECLQINQSLLIISQ
jgi:hypothetical protein